MTYYFAHVDKNGLLCVDTLDDEKREPTKADVMELADLYPDWIYFEYTKPVEMYYFAFEGDIHGVDCLSPQGYDEEHTAMIAERNPDLIVFAVEVIES